MPFISSLRRNYNHKPSNPELVVDAEGSDVSYTVGGYKVHMFLGGPAEFKINSIKFKDDAMNLVLTPPPLSVEWLVVAGGGGGYNAHSFYWGGGGGGAGGYVTSTSSYGKIGRAHV